ncbi:LysR family transcriptional regulator (plasmid) [Cupriavidus necator]|uniref:LysR family transcriptional regulator n=1 Tax=Cupriavidus necator TaxID=106590 RepID=A0A367P7M6_CUPNE|nr:LysR substrate-binding domain-containing protein [Cupriavidus necator]QQX89291.1 LysR family transcriptional regulator [Cupriavidus necator]RCJ03574.1 LysR family transcriptional regulator [Cupriavidus necator]
MKIRSPSLVELHAFAAVVEKGSFSAAAHKLAVTQGAVSRAVIKLEARFGYALLERAHGGVLPTAKGLSYYETIKPALDTLDDAAPGTSDNRRRQLHVRVVTSFGTRWLVPRLPSLAMEAPELEIVFRSYVANDDMLDKNVDCWIDLRRTPGARWPRHVRGTYVAGRQLLPICHPTVAAEIQRPEDFLRFPLLYHIGFPENWNHWLQSQGVKGRQLRLAAGFDLSANLIEGVCANMGVAVVPACLVEREIAEGRVSAPVPKTADTKRGYYLCIPRARENERYMELFRNWLLRQAQERLG